MFSKIDKVVEQCFKLIKVRHVDFGILFYKKKNIDQYWLMSFSLKVEYSMVKPLELFVECW